MAAHWNLSAVKELLQLSRECGGEKGENNFLNDLAGDGKPKHPFSINESKFALKGAGLETTEVNCQSHSVSLWSPWGRCGSDGGSAVGFSPRSVLLQYLTLPQAFLLHRGHTMVWECSGDKV